MLKALISYFPEKESQTGVGALEYPVEERKKLALQSKKWVCPSCGPIINLVKETEEEKKAEEVPENNSESKNKVDIEEVSVEMAGQKREDENVNNDVELEERKSEDIEEEKIEIPQRKEIDIREQQQKRQSSLYQFFKEDMQKNIFEHDFQHLQTGI